MANQHADSNRLSGNALAEKGLTDPSMQVRVNWLGDDVFVGISGAGFQVKMAGAPPEGQADQGIRPMEMMLLAIGGCSSYDVVSILKKARQAVSHCQVVVQGKRADAVFRAGEIHHAVVVGAGCQFRRIAARDAVDQHALAGADHGCAEGLRTRGDACLQAF